MTFMVGPSATASSCNRFLPDLAVGAWIENATNKWIRFVVNAGDLVLLPAGIYHRFTLDERNMIKARMFFKVKSSPNITSRVSCTHISFTHSPGPAQMGAPLQRRDRGRQPIQGGIPEEYCSILSACSISSVRLPGPILQRRRVPPRCAPCARNTYQIIYILVRAVSEVEFKRTLNHLGV